MKNTNFKYVRGWKRQKGMTLMELLVAGTISLIAASGMVIVMANTLGTGSQTIQAARLTQEMRTAMQIMSREVRRGNYHADYMACYGNAGCRATLGIEAKITPIQITDSGDSDCFWFSYHRPGLTLDTSPIAAFRHTELTNSAGLVVGVLQMTTTLLSSSTCPGSDWVEITDPEIIDVQEFNVVDAGFTEPIGATGTQRVDRVSLTIRAKLITDPLTITGLTAPTDVVRELQEFVTVRNNTTTL